MYWDHLTVLGMLLKKNISPWCRLKSMWPTKMNVIINVRFIYSDLLAITCKLQELENVFAATDCSCYTNSMVLRMNSTRLIRMASGSPMWSQYARRLPERVTALIFQQLLLGLAARMRRKEEHGLGCVVGGGAKATDVGGRGVGRIRVLLLRVWQVRHFLTKSYSSSIVD